MERRYLQKHDFTFRELRDAVEEQLPQKSTESPTSFIPAHQSLMFCLSCRHRRYPLASSVDALSFPECPTLTYKVYLTLHTLHMKEQLCLIIFRQKCIMCLWPSTQPWPLTFLALLRFGIHIMLCHHWQWQTDMNGVKFSHMVPPEPGCAPMKRPQQSIYNWWGGHMNPIKSPCEVQLMEIHGKMGHFAWGSLTGF